MAVQLQHIRKSFDGRPVLHDLSMTLQNGHSYCLMGASGRGKTTLLRILLQLLKPDSGRISGIVSGETAVMFQENRLCEYLSPIENVALVRKERPDREKIRAGLAMILPEEYLDRPVSQLSGGMKRRAALGRALFYDSKMIVLDEPFTGLDRKTKAVVVDYILKMQQGRILLFTSHSPEDAEMLQAQTLTIDSLERKAI